MHWMILSYLLDHEKNTKYPSICVILNRLRKNIDHAQIRQRLGDLRRKRISFDHVSAMKGKYFYAHIVIKYFWMILKPALL